METYKIKAGYTFTVTTDALTDADYVLVQDNDNAGGFPTNIGYGASATIGPFTNDRTYGIILRGAGYTVSSAFVNEAADIAALAPKASPTFTGTVTLPATWKVGSTTVTATGAELNYVHSVTSAIQTQLNSKAAASGVTFQADLANDATGTDIAVFVNGLKAALIAAGIMAAS